MFQLYVGLVRNGEWYNHAECVPLQGGVLALLDSKGKTGGQRILQIVKSAVPSLYTASGKEYKMKEQDYFDFPFVDSQKVNRESMKLFSGEKHPTFDESFYCNRCSRAGRERYTTIKESWDLLIEKGQIDETYLKSPDEMRFRTELPVGIEVEPGKSVSGGIFNVILREHLTLGELIQVQDNSFAMETEANMACATWDLEIKEVEGMTERELNILRRNPKESFTKKYLVHQEDVDAMIETPEAGMNAEFRKVKCQHCGAEIGGHLDFTNFFSFYTQKATARAPHR